MGDLHRLQRVTWLVERTEEQTRNNAPNPAGYQGPVKIELLKGAGLRRKNQW